MAGAVAEPRASHNHEANLPVERVASERPAGSLRGRAGVELIALAAIALGVRLIQLDNPPFIDELNHVLAARALLVDGTLDLGGEDPYNRARGFTYAIAALFKVFGEGLVVGRIPAVLAGAGLVVLMFVWIRFVAGSLAAWIAALLLCFYPYSLFLSQQVRFYTVHALAFWAGVCCVFWLLRMPWRPRRAAALAGTAILCFLIAKHLTQLTVVGVAGMLLWVAPSAARPVSAYVRSSPRRTGAALTVAALLVFVIARWFISGDAAESWQMFNYSDLWAARFRDDIRYYHYLLLDQYGTMWSVFPLVALVAVSTRARLSLLFLSIFGFALVFHSVAAWKAERYIYYAMPAFFGIIGIASGAGILWLRERLRRLRLTPAWMLDIFLLLLVVFTLRFGWGVNDAFDQATAIVTAGSGVRPTPYAKSDWQSVVPYVQDDLAAGAVVVASANLKSIYFLERLDYDLGQEHLESLAGISAEFGLHSKHGRPIIARPESVAEVVRCHARGVVVIEEHHWGRDWAVPKETADYIGATLERVTVPERLQLYVFRWQRPAPAAPPADCPPRVE